MLNKAHMYWMTNSIYHHSYLGFNWILNSICVGTLLFQAAGVWRWQWAGLWGRSSGAGLFLTQQRDDVTPIATSMATEKLSSAAQLLEASSGWRWYLSAATCRQRGAPLFAHVSAHVSKLCRRGSRTFLRKMGYDEFHMESRRGKAARGLLALAS